MKKANLPEAAYWRPRILDEILSRRHAIIEASAGTGKTFTIEHLFVDLLCTNPHSIEQILLVTFTEKATSELRVRIRKLIETILHGTTVGPISLNVEKVVLGDEGRRRLEQALLAFDRASIFTIHGFCQRVLTDFAFLAGTRFDLQVVDAYRPFHHAFRAELRERLADKSASRGLLEEWLRDGRHINDFEALLLKAHQNRYLESNPAASRIEMAERFDQSFDATALAHAYRSSGLNARKTTAALTALDELKQLTRGSSIKLLESLKGFNFKPLMQVKEIDKSGKPLLLIPKFLRMIADLQVAVAIEARGSAALETALVEMYLPAVAARLDRDKRERGQIDYGDMLLWVWQALDAAGGTELAQTLRDRFRFCLADEFQDTDDLQWRILRRIFVEHSGNNRFFVVGDPKQAIYAFRGADVHTYLGACGELAAASATRVPLVTNFRSNASVIDALNHIFDQRAHVPFFSGEITYRDPARCGQPERTATDSRGYPIKPVVLMRYQPKEGMQGSAVEAREAVGHYIGRTLRQMLFDEADQLTIREPDAAPRMVKPKDIFVLTRTKRESEEIGSYLAEFGVPFAFYKLEGLFQTNEAREVCDILRAIDEPHDHSRRLRAWGSRFFAVRYRDLPTLNDIPESHPLNNRLYEWRVLAEEERFADLFESLLHESGLAERELFFSRGERELTNFLHIFEVLLERTVASRLSLTSFSRIISPDAKSLPDPTETYSVSRVSERPCKS
jgi:exodeoxyribonuclease V beta subunit